MAKNFTQNINFDGKNVLVVIVPSLRKDGMYYEVNAPGVPRFYMRWSQADRYDIVPEEGLNVPYNLLLAVSDAIEKHGAK